MDPNLHGSPLFLAHIIQSLDSSSITRWSDSFFQYAQCRPNKFSRHLICFLHMQWAQEVSGISSFVPENTYLASWLWVLLICSWEHLSYLILPVGHGSSSFVSESTYLTSWSWVPLIATITMKSADVKLVKSSSALLYFYPLMKLLNSPTAQRTKSLNSSVFTAKKATLSLIITQAPHI